MLSPWFALESVKEDIHCTAAELVHGTTLCYLASSSTLPAMYIAFGLPCNNSEHPQFILLNVRLTSLTAFALAHVFVRHDAIWKPLQHPYDGPYEVLSRSNKHFTLDIRGTQKKSPWIVSNQPTWNTPPQLRM